MYTEWWTKKIQRQGNANVGVEGEVTETGRPQFPPLPHTHTHTHSRLGQCAIVHSDLIHYS